MRYVKWIAIGAAILLIIAGFIPWVKIDFKDLTITGVDTTGTTYGKPAYFHFILAVLFITCSLIQRVWAKRLNLLVTAVNLAWAVRNFFILATCSGGECPQRQTGLWLVLLSSIIMLAAALFPDMKVNSSKKPGKINIG
jgi:hypothetical protein